jgi:aryl-alcohol dehydrogenase-like predicted oxidoreductase
MDITANPAQNSKFIRRFAIANDAISTVLVGYSTMQQLEYAAHSIDKGPLSREALARLASLQSSFVGERR